jgi:hypothetical protein
VTSRTDDGVDGYMPPCYVTRMARSSLFRLLVAALGAASAGCVTVPTQVVRVSTVQLISAEKSSTHYSKPPSVVFEAVKVELASRGFMLANQIDAKSSGAKFYLFKGARKDVTHIRGNSRIIVAETHEIGSMFVARLLAVGGGTELLLLGKPTISGVDLCSDADTMLADGGYWCKDTTIRSDYPGLPLMTGREEVDVVQGTLAALAEKLK